MAHSNNSHNVAAPAYILPNSSDPITRHDSPNTTSSPQSEPQAITLLHPNKTDPINTASEASRSCNRAHTFETFLDGEQMPRNDQEKETGHGWEAWQALKRMFRRSGKKVDHEDGGGERRN